MKRHAHLSLLGVVCRLAPNDWGAEKAATQWEEIFGIPRSRDLAAFTNARLGFLHGKEGQPEGIMSISIGVKGETKRNEIFKRAEERGVLDGDEQSRNFVNMLGVRWNFVLTGSDDEPQSKL